MGKFNFDNIKCHVRALSFKHPFLLAGLVKKIKLSLKTNYQIYSSLLGIGSSIFIWRFHNKLSKFIFIRSFSSLIYQDIIGIHFISQNDDNQNNNRLEFIFHTIRFIQYCSLLFNSDNSNLQLITHYSRNVVYLILDLICFNGKAIMVNSRNEVLLQDIQKNCIEQRIVGKQKCILYSARILHVTKHFIVVASGTVFKEVLIWGIDIGNSVNHSLIDIQTLYGHDGVIFDINYNQELNILISVSDDRSIRIWKGCNDACTAGTLTWWHSNQFTLIHIYYGHEARIWKVRSLLFKNMPICISVGEDSSLVVWSLSAPFGMKQRKRLYRNNRIWSMEITPDFIVCGGSDGSVQFFPIENILKTNSVQLLSNQNEHQQIKAINLIQTSTDIGFLACSVGGKFFFKSNNSQFKNINFNYDNFSTIFNDFIKMAIYHDRTKLAIGSKDGYIGLINFKNIENIELIFLKKVFQCKIFDLNFVNDDHLIISLNNGIVKLYQLNIDCTESPFTAVSDHDYILPVSRHRWSSCGVLYKNFLAIGDYSGNVFAFDINSTDPFLICRNIHGKNGVTSIQIKPDSCLMYSSGRNGRIMEYYIEECFETGKVINCFKLRTFALFSNMEWISGFLFDQTKTISFVYGFESRNFLVWNMYQEIVEFEVDCGGGHRPFDIIIQPIENENVKFDFYYCKKNDLFNITSTSYCTMVSTSLNYSSIPRKINCCSLLLQKELCSYFMIGGEDTLIQIIRYQKETNNFNLYRILSGHISNVTSIKCLNRIDNEWYSISVGGRSQLILWKFWFNSFDGLICQEKAMNFLGLYNEQMEFEENIRKSNQNDLLELDVRYLDVDFIINSSVDHLEMTIIVACSDSAFRILYYNEQIPKKIVLLNKVDLSLSCILRCKILPRHFHLNTLDGACAFSTNNGYIQIWSFKTDNSSANNSELIFSFQPHQNGINSFDLSFDTNNGRFKFYSKKKSIISFSCLW